MTTTLGLVLVIAGGLVGVGCTSVGVLAYVGRFRWWLEWRDRFGQYAGFAFLYAGLAVLLLATLLLVGPGALPPIVEPALYGSVVLFGLTAFFGRWWLPPFLRPRWFGPDLAELDSKERLIMSDEPSRFSTGYLTLLAPPEFETVLVDGVDLVLRFRHDYGGYRPNIVVTSSESAAPLVDASWDALASARTNHPGAAIIACDAEMLHADFPGRRITFVYPAEETDVVVTERIWATGERHIRLAVTNSVEQHTALAFLFDDVVRSIAFADASDGFLDAARRSGDAPQDPALSERVGLPLEDLSALPTEGFVSRGAVVETEPLDALVAAAGSHRFSWRRRRVPDGTDPARTAQLTRAGWTDDAGRLTATGAALAAAIADGRLILTAIARRGQAERLLLAYATDDGTTAIVHEPALAEAAVRPTQRIVSLVRDARVPAFVASWIDLRPAWSLGVDTTVDATELEARVEGRPGVRAWTSVHLDGPVRLDGPEPGSSVHVVVTPERDVFAVDDLADGGYGLATRSSGSVFDRLIGLWAEGRGRTAMR